jgi:curved DNA-binding protein CbpA
VVASSHYDRLGIGRSASAQEITRAYRALCRRYHPDLNGGREDALRMMQAVNEAYAVLRDPARRSSYDRSFARRPAGPVQRRQPRRPVQSTPRRWSLGAWVQAAMLATSIVLTFAPSSATAGTSVGASLSLRP